MGSKELSLWVKQAIRLKNQSRPIRKMSKSLGVAKSFVWNILKKKACSNELSTPINTEDHRIYLRWKKSPFTAAGQINNTIQEGGVCASKSTTKRRLHQSKYKGLATRCKPLEPPKQEDQIRACQTTHHDSSRTTSYGQMRRRLTCTRVTGRKELFTIQNIPTDQWSMVVIAVSWIGNVWLHRNWFPCI